MEIGVIPSGYGVDACEMLADASNTRLTISLDEQADLDRVWAMLFIIFIISTLIVFIMFIIGSRLFTLTAFPGLGRTCSDQ